MRRPAPAIVIVLLLAGCGNDPTRPPDTRTPDPPRGERIVRYRDAGIRYVAPFNWQDLNPQGARQGGIQSKRAALIVWRYPRSEPLPDSPRELREARRRLLERVRKRDPTFELRSARVFQRAGAPTIELTGRQTMAGLPRAVRSSHIFFANAEIVFDAYAPPEHFERVDEQVFLPVLRSVRLSRP